MTTPDRFVAASGAHDDGIYDIMSTIRRETILIALLAIAGCGSDRTPQPAGADLSSVAPPDLPLPANPDLQSPGDLAGCRLEGQTCTGTGRGDCCPIGDVQCSAAGVCVSTLP
jgi:hypothetical protein